MRQRLFIFVLLFILLKPVFAQQYINGFKRFGSAEGVPNSNNYKLFESSDHFLWLSTESGLYKFDGFQFIPFFSKKNDSTTISSNVIGDIEEDRLGNLWVSTFGRGVNRLDIKTGKWKQYVHPTIDEHWHYWVFDFFKDSQGRLWLGTNGRGLLLYDENTDSFHQFLPDNPKNITAGFLDGNQLRSIAADAANPDLLWMAGINCFYRFDTKSKKFTSYKNTKNGKADWINISFHNIHVQDASNIWLGAWGGGLIHFNIQTSQFTNYPPSPQEYAKKNSSRNIISHIAYCSDTSLYVSTASDGLLEFNLRKHVFKKINEIQSTNGKNVSEQFNGITHTSDGSTWVCSPDYIFQKHPVYERLALSQSFYQPKEKYVYRPSLVGLIYRKDNKQYWMSCNAGYGVYVYDNNFNYLRSVAIENNAADRRLRNIVQDASGTIWLLSKDFPYLYYYDKIKDRFLNAALKFKDNTFISSGLMEMTADKKGNVWWTNNKELLKWDPLIKQLQTFPINDTLIKTTNSSLQSVKLLFDADDNPWLASTAGLYYFNQSNTTWQHLISLPNNEQSLANNLVESFAFDKKGNCWIAPSDEGLQLYNPSVKKFIKHYIQSKNFFETRVHDVITDVKGDLWIASNNGLARYDMMQDQWFRFNTADGLSEANLFGSLFAMDDGTMILSTQNGFTHWNIHSLPLNNQKPIVYFNRFISGGKELEVEVDRILLPSSANELSIDFSAISTVMGNRTKFFYKILPLQKEWTAIAQRSVSLAGFTSGKYALDIKAVNSDGVESEIKEFTIIVAYPFWKTWWFIALCLLAIAGILYWLYRYRVQQLLKMQLMRNNISRDLHDEIGSSVSSVNMLSLVAKKQLGDEHPVTPLLTQIGQSAQNAGDSIDEIIWSVNPGNDSARDTINRMRKYLSEIFELHGIEYTIQLPEIDAHKKLSMQVRRDLWLICKEAVNNMVKYANCSKAGIKMEVTNGTLHIKIDDNGVGFVVKTAIAKKRNGLVNMKERVQKYKACTFEIDSKPGSGTTLLFQIPMNE